MMRRSPDVSGFLPLKPAVLQVLLTLAEEPTHGYGIMSAVRARSDGWIDLGTSHLYRHLKRLLDDGLVSETDADPADGRDDARRRYYDLTDLGVAVLAAEVARLDRVVKQSRSLGIYGGRAR